MWTHTHLTSCMQNPNIFHVTRFHFQSRPQLFSSKLSVSWQGHGWMGQHGKLEVTVDSSSLAERRQRKRAAILGLHTHTHTVTYTHSHVPM